MVKYDTSLAYFFLVLNHDANDMVHNGAYVACKMSWCTCHVAYGMMIMIWHTLDAHAITCSITIMVYHHMRVQGIGAKWCNAHMRWWGLISVFLCHGAHDSVHDDAYAMMHTRWHRLYGAYGMMVMVWFMTHDAYVFTQWTCKNYCKMRVMLDEDDIMQFLIKCTQLLMQSLYTWRLHDFILLVE